MPSVSNFALLQTSRDEAVWRDLLSTACSFAQNSPDQSTQNAAVLCNGMTMLPLTWAVNEFPRGVTYSDARWERPGKYEWIEHAERNAVFAAARRGISTDGLTMVCPWAACSDCARAVIQAGVSRLVTLRPKQEDTHARWDASISVAMTMLDEAGVEVVYIDGPLDCGVTLKRNG